MVKVLKLSDTEIGQSYQPRYQSEIFEWLQNPDRWHQPMLEMGHRAVLCAAFDDHTLLTIARQINDIDDPNERTGLQLVVAGIDYADVAVSEIASDIDTSFEAAGAQPRAHRHAENRGATGTTYGFSDVFTTANYEANEALAWFEHRTTTSQPESLNGYARNRILKITKEEDPRKAKEAVDRMRNVDIQLARLLFAGFRSAVLLADYERQRITDTAEHVTAAVQKRYELPAASTKKYLLDFPRAAFELASLPSRNDWGDDVACEKKDDVLLEAGEGKSAVDPRARLLCGSCAVRLYCLRDSLEDNANVVRGGLSGAERRRLRKHMGLKDNPAEIDQEPELEVEEEIAS